MVCVVASAPASVVRVDSVAGKEGAHTASALEEEPRHCVRQAQRIDGVRMIAAGEGRLHRNVTARTREPNHLDSRSPWHEQVLEHAGGHHEVVRRGRYVTIARLDVAYQGTTPAGGQLLIACGRRSDKVEGRVVHVPPYPHLETLATVPADIQALQLLRFASSGAIGDVLNELCEQLLGCAYRSPVLGICDAALEALPAAYVYEGEVRRGVPWVYPSPFAHEPSQHFRVGQKVMWYEFKSTSTRMEVMTRPHFCGVQAGPRTIFTIQACSALHKINDMMEELRKQQYTKEAQRLIDEGSKESLEELTLHEKATDMANSKGMEPGSKRKKFIDGDLDRRSAAVLLVACSCPWCPSAA